MPTNERRYHIGLLNKKQEDAEEEKEKILKTKNNGKGSKQTKISGDALKAKLKSGEIPLK